MTGRKLDNAVIDLMHAIGLLVRRVRAAAGSEELSWTESLDCGFMPSRAPGRQLLQARLLRDAP